MRPTRCFILGLAITAIACGGDPTATSSSHAPRSAPPRPSGAAGGIELAVTGSGHVPRDLGAGAELTTFSYSAIRRFGSATTGQFQFNFRALDLVVHGTVTCVTAAGNIAWVGGVIDRLQSDDPADQELVGTDIWWRVTDRGEGSGASADLTTSLLFTIPGNPTTAASWCADQPTRGVERLIESGNIQVKID